MDLMLNGLVLCKSTEVFSQVMKTMLSGEYIIRGDQPFWSIHCTTVLSVLFFAVPTIGVYCFMFISWRDSHWNIMGDADISREIFFFYQIIRTFFVSFSRDQVCLLLQSGLAKKKSGNSALAPNTVLDIMTHTSYEMVLYILFIPLAGVCVLTIHKTCRLEKYTTIRLITDIDTSHRGDVLYLYTRYVIGFVFLKRYFYIRSVSLN